MLALRFFEVRNYFRSSPQKRGPSAKAEGVTPNSPDWIPAYAGMNGVCSRHPRAQIEQHRLDLRVLHVDALA